MGTDAFKAGNNIVFPVKTFRKTRSNYFGAIGKSCYRFVIVYIRNRNTMFLGRKVAFFLSKCDMKLNGTNYNSYFD